jgi:hypothetical protein
MAKIDFRQPGFLFLKAVFVFPGRCGRRPRCHSCLSFLLLIRMHSSLAEGDQFNHPSGSSMQRPAWVSDQTAAGGLSKRKVGSSLLCTLPATTPNSFARCGPSTKTHRTGRISRWRHLLQTSSSAISPDSSSIWAISHKVIVALTVQEILNEQIAKSLRDAA